MPVTRWHGPAFLEAAGRGCLQPAPHARPVLPPLQPPRMKSASLSTSERGGTSLPALTSRGGLLQRNVSCSSSIVATGIVRRDDAELEAGQHRRHVTHETPSEEGRGQDRTASPTAPPRQRWCWRAGRDASCRLLERAAVLPRCEARSCCEYELQPLWAGVSPRCRLLSAKLVRRRS